ncbi:hypothetical protein HYC85_030465 [Camellia sinensis]|uniref:Uncharacterized protein n=1 Tax=Camellia sinensis TaxID=4442 RepID=A0A7J7G4P0_CAMSI|nr:hypothetical protein HYC85_030465 [Camellia sinensis]
MVEVYLSSTEFWFWERWSGGCDLFQVWSVGPRVSSLLAERRRAMSNFVFGLFSEPESGQRVTVHLLSVWLGGAPEEVFSSVGWHIWCIWFKTNIESPTSTVSIGLEGQSRSLFSSIYAASLCSEG